MELGFFFSQNLITTYCRDKSLRIKQSTRLFRTASFPLLFGVHPPPPGAAPQQISITADLPVPIASPTRPTVMGMARSAIPAPPAILVQASPRALSMIQNLKKRRQIPNTHCTASFQIAVTFRSFCCHTAHSGKMSLLCIASGRCCTSRRTHTVV